MLFGHALIMADANGKDASTKVVRA